MALKNINKFNWEKLLAKTENAADMKRKLLVLRGKANEITVRIATNIFLVISKIIFKLLILFY